MACGPCSGRKNPTTTEYLVTYRDGTEERVADMIAAKRRITIKGGGTYKVVAKKV